MPKLVMKGGLDNIRGERGDLEVLRLFKGGVERTALLLALVTRQGGAQSWKGALKIDRRN
jgi:hypothetical protein